MLQLFFSASRRACRAFPVEDDQSLTIFARAVSLMSIALCMHTTSIFEDAFAARSCAKTGDTKSEITNTRVCTAPVNRIGLNKYIKFHVSRCPRLYPAV